MNLSRKAKFILLFLFFVLAWHYHAQIFSYIKHNVALEFQPCHTVNAYLGMSECLGQVAHTSLNGKMVVTPDGSLLATGTVDGLVRLWDIQTIQPTLRSTIMVKNAEPNQAALHFFATSGWDDDIDALTFAPDSQSLTVAMTGQPISTYHVDALPTEAIEKPELRTSNVYTSINKLAFSPDGTILAAYEQNEEIIHLFDSETLALNGVIEGLGFGFASDNQTLLIINVDGYVEKWTYKNDIGLTGTSSEPLQIKLRPQNIEIKFSSDGRQAIMLNTSRGIHLAGGNENANSLFNYERFSGEIEHEIHFNVFDMNSLNRSASWTTNPPRHMYVDSLLYIVDDTITLAAARDAMVANVLRIGFFSLPSGRIVRKPYSSLSLYQWTLQGVEALETTQYSGSYLTVGFSGTAITPDGKHIYATTSTLGPHDDGTFGYLQVWGMP